MMFLSSQVWQHHRLSCGISQNFDLPQHLKKKILTAFVYTDDRLSLYPFADAFYFFPASIGISRTNSLISYHQDKISPLLVVCVLLMDLNGVCYLDHMLLLVNVTMGLIFSNYKGLISATLISVTLQRIKHGRYFIIKKIKLK